MDGDDYLIICECGFVKLLSTVVCDICFNEACKSDLIWLDDD
jgi:hypothetical protein